MVKKAAQTAERGKFDAIFLADEFSFAAGRGPNRSETLLFEPLTLLSHLAAVTNRIGLVATASTTYEEPYHVARRFSALDHLSDGRAGWNVVTSSHSADRNFGPDRYEEHDRRYLRAEEFIAVTKGYWDVWGDDTFVRDREAGIFFDAATEKPFVFQGQYFDVSGPVNFPRPRQGHPVIFQAGASPAGAAFGARHGEVIFVTGQSDINKAKAFYSATKARVREAGRDANDVVILPGLAPVVGRTQAEAEDKFDQLTRLLRPDVGLDILASLNGGFDFSQYDINGPVPEVPLTDGNQTRQRVALDAARSEKLTIRQLYERFAGGVNKVIGTPEKIADRIAEWFEAEAADGLSRSFARSRPRKAIWWR